MIDPVWPAIAVAFISSVVGPWVIARQTAKTAAAKEKASNEREDAKAKRAEAVAARVERTAELLKESNAKIAAKVEESAKVVDGKLNEVIKTSNETHVLVNSNYTELVRDAVVLLTALVAQLRKDVARDKAAGLAPDEHTAAALTAAMSKLAEREAQLTDRAVAALFVMNKHEI